MLLSAISTLAPQMVLPKRPSIVLWLCPQFSLRMKRRIPFRNGEGAYRTLMRSSMLCTGCDQFPIKGLIETSFLDWKERLSSVIFLGGCNFRCPFCHNKELVLEHATMEDMPVEYLIATLRKYKNWIDSVVVSGGEPTINMSLFGLIGQLKSEGMHVKLDTNGSNPSILKGLVNDGLIDCVAMDVKGPLDRYSRWCGINVDTRRIRESIEFIMEGAIDYEFRMTVVPFLHQEDDVYEVASFIKDAKKFFIQEFRPDSTLNPAYAKMQPFSSDKMTRIRTNVAEIMTRDEGVCETSMRKYGAVREKTDPVMQGESLIG
ncbi:MAG: anaerobic ribonucleoside-triphosphate reductase activating protein [Syntrophus sp. (in: bacteria)]|nr:anaerobic ribonucleoside-triphosphate reductase activating protein [Syntrophus sp. (in: bacteria)]